MAFSRLTSGLEQVQSVLRATAQAATEASGQVRTASADLEESAAQISAGASSVRRELETAVERTEERTERLKTLIGPELANILAQLEDTQSGFDLAFKQFLEAYLEGVGDIHSATDDFSGIIQAIDGEFTAISSKMKEILPTVGQVQQSFRDFLKEIKGEENEIEQILERLQGSFTNISQTIANLGELILEGGADVDVLIEELNRLRKNGFGGSQAAILGRRLKDALQERLRGRGRL